MPRIAKRKGDCNHGEVCLTHHLWQDLSDQIHNFLSDISLADLVSNGPQGGARIAGLTDSQMVAVRQL